MTSPFLDPARDEMHLVQVEVEGDADHRLRLRRGGELLDPHRERGFVPRMLLRVAAVDEDVLRDPSDGSVVVGLDLPGEPGGLDVFDADEGADELVILLIGHRGGALLEDEHELSRLPLAVVQLLVGAVEHEAHTAERCHEALQIETLAREQHIRLGH